MPTVTTANPETDPTTEPGSAEALFNDACEIMRDGDYDRAIDNFNEADEKRGESTPDTQRNLGWCHYRKGELALIHAEHDESLKLFSRAREHYRQAEEGFKKMREDRQSLELRKRIDSRIQDCQLRVGGIRSFGEFMHRKHEFIQEKRKKAEEEKAELHKIPDMEDNMGPVSVRVAPPPVR